jgi:hypothetical protein
MAYQHIDNLYKDVSILAFRECYAMEKIHGTSAHVSWDGVERELKFFSGGCKHALFEGLFDHEALETAFAALGQERVVVYGEAYGGKLQGMSETYGKDTKFIAFEVRIGDKWLAVPQAEHVVLSLGLEFVDWVKTSTDIEKLDALRDHESIQAQRNGMGIHPREGIVLRPLFEATMNNGKRVVAKHKNDAFKERRHPPKVGVNPEVLQAAEAIADEWATHERLKHVADAAQLPLCVENIGPLIKAMQSDIAREARDEIIPSDAAWKAVARRTAIMVKDACEAQLRT